MRMLAAVQENCITYLQGDSMNLKTEVMIFSLNNLNYLKVLEDRGIPYKAVYGCYKACKEISYIVNIQEDSVLDFVTICCKEDGQESILKLDANRIGTLVYLQTSSSIVLGQLRVVSAIEASNLDAWTLDKLSNTYYAI